MRQQKEIIYEQFDSLQALPTEDRALVEAATEATLRAYAPYSHFRVGAAARLLSGEIITAANCESEVFPSGMCAERSLLHYYATNYATDPIEALAIASDPSERECYPCGACRQVILDAERRQQSPIRIIMAGGGTATTVESAESLLPFTFML
ncbi:MAG: cytidine deaminase [Alistipes sp.]|nr:cytidine deaminase [Alistipes sp.]